MIEEEIETSGTDKAFSIKIFVPTIFFVSEIMRKEEIYLAHDPFLDKHLELDQILMDIMASGVDGTATLESR